MKNLIIKRALMLMLSDFKIAMVVIWAFAWRACVGAAGIFVIGYSAYYHIWMTIITLCAIVVALLIFLWFLDRYYTVKEGGVQLRLELQ